MQAATTVKPTTSASASIAPESPTNVDVSLDYITVESYQWPKSEPPKRHRLEEEERKRRHREGQRQFMVRKRCRIKALRTIVAGWERQLAFAQLVEEARRLSSENREIQRKLQIPLASPPLHAAPEPKHLPFAAVQESEVLDSNEMDTLLCEVISSW